MPNRHPQPPKRPAHRLLVIPLVLLLVLTVGTVSVYLLQTARLLDEREAKQTIRLAQSALNAELNHLGDWAYDYGYWDESLAKLIDDLDPQWADRNIGSYLAESYGITASVVYGMNDELRIAFYNGKRVGRSETLLTALRDKAAPLVTQARELSFLGPKAATGLLRIDSKVYLAAAQAILPEDEPAPLQAKRGVLMLLREFDQNLRYTIAQEYLLPKLALNQGRPDPDQAFLTLKAVTGEEIGNLQWQPARPGHKLFITLAPAIPVPLLLGLGLVVFFLRRMRLFFRERMALYQQLEQEKLRLEESEGTLRTIIEAIPSPLFFKNIEGYYLGCNQAFCDYLGLPRNQIIGHTVHEVAPQDLAEIYHQADLELMHDGGRQSYEAQVRYADGTRRDILFNKATINSQSDKVIGLVGIMTDISAVKDAQRESRRLRRLLRNVIDSMPSMLITVDEKQCVTEWNRWAAIASRVSADRALGRPLFEVFPALAEQHIDLTAALNSGKVQSWPRIPWTLHDREIFVDLTVYPLDKDKGHGAVLRADNSTDRVRMEEVMVLSEKMLSIGSLAAGMAHEINNPLAIILQHAQVIGNRLNPELSKNRRTAEECDIDLQHMNGYLEQRGIFEMLAAIRKAGDRARQIVEEMVNFSQRQKPSYSPCDLKALIDETLHLAETDYDLKKKYAFNRIELRREIAPDLPPLTCDRHDIQQVLLNLLRNSARALHEKGGASPAITLRVESKDEAIIIEVTDTGPGIEPALLKRIFEPFFTTGNAGEGTGLGLSVAYFIIHEKHGGEIRVENLDTGGCRFLITLPFNTSALQEGSR